MLPAANRLYIAVVLMLTSASAAIAQAAPFSGSLSGSVLTDPGEKPIANAEIMLTDLKMSVRSDSKGNFIITGVGPGEHALVVRGIGFESFEGTMTFRDAQKVEADFTLKTITTKLSKVVVRDTIAEHYRIKLTEFEERRKLGIGHFLTAEMFDKNKSNNMSQLLKSRIPGIQADGVQSKQILVSTRDRKPFCPVQVIVNGIVRYNGAPMMEGDYFDINSIFAGDVVGVEYYTVATTPLQYNSTSVNIEPNKKAVGGVTCGTIIIWTK